MGGKKELKKEKVTGWIYLRMAIGHKKTCKRKSEERMVMGLKIEVTRERHRGG